jgi:hypothetical protein
MPITKEQSLYESEKLGRCELLKIEVEGARARLGLRHAGAGDEAKEANGRGLHFASVGEERVLNKAQLEGSRREKEQARGLAVVVRQSRSPDVRSMS